MFECSNPTVKTIRKQFKVFLKKFKLWSIYGLLLWLFEIPWIYSSMIIFCSLSHNEIMSRELAMITKQHKNILHNIGAKPVCILALYLIFYYLADIWSCVIVAFNVSELMSHKVTDITNLFSQVSLLMVSSDFSFTTYIMQYYHNISWRL